MSLTINNRLTSIYSLLHFKFFFNLKVSYYIWLNRKDFITMGTWVILKTLKKHCLVNKTFVFSWQVKNIHENYKYIFKVSDRFQIKRMKSYYDWKYDTLLLDHVFQKIKNSNTQSCRLCSNHLSTLALN